MPILVNNIQDKLALADGQIELIERVVESGLKRYERDESEASIILVDNSYIQELNSQYRGLDQPTDVLSFAMTEGSGMPGQVFEGIPELLGDIFISVERARDQAAEYGHSFERELCFLAVHGLLHLLGFDHQSEEETRAMRAAEEEVLVAFELGREPR